MLPSFLTSHTLHPNGKDDSEKAEAAAYYSGLLEAAFAGAAGCGLLVLDEAMSACATEMIDEGRLLELLRQGAITVVIIPIRAASFLFSKNRV